MVSVAVVVDGEGCLSSLRAAGHARCPGGENLPCAALSLLARTAWESFLAIPRLAVEGRAEGEGDLELRLGDPDRDNRGLVEGASLFLLTGLEGLKRDFPGQFDIEITRMRRKSNGS